MGDQSRRDFLKRSSTVAGSVVGIGVLSTGESRAAEQQWSDWEPVDTYRSANPIVNDNGSELYHTIEWRHKPGEPRFGGFQMYMDVTGGEVETWSGTHRIPVTKVGMDALLPEDAKIADFQPKNRNGSVSSSWSLSASLSATGPSVSIGVTQTESTPLYSAGSTVDRSEAYLETEADISGELQTETVVHTAALTFKLPDTQCGGILTSGADFVGEEMIDKIDGIGNFAEFNYEDGDGSITDWSLFGSSTTTADAERIEDELGVDIEGLRQNPEVDLPDSLAGPQPNGTDSDTSDRIPE